MNKGITLYALRVTLNTANERENEIHSPYFEISEYHTTDAELISHLTLYKSLAVKPHAFRRVDTRRILQN